MKKLKDKNIFRKILMVAGALHILFFFLMSYAKLNELVQGLSSTARMFGISDTSILPTNLTGFNMIKMLIDIGQPDSAAVMGVCFGFILIAAFFTILMSYRGTRKRSYVGCIFMSLLMMINYASIYNFVEYIGSSSSDPYRGKPSCLVAIVLAIAQLFVAIIGCILDKSTRANKRNRTVTDSENTRG
jgi:hypothetical protein